MEMGKSLVPEFGLEGASGLLPAAEAPVELIGCKIHDMLQMVAWKEAIIREPVRYALAGGHGPRGRKQADL